MAFKLGDILIDRIQYGYAESLGADAAPLYVLTQLSEATINITAESQDVTDAQGNLVKRIWRSKAGTLEAQNAMINTNIIAAASGTDAVFATSGKKVVMPKIVTVKKGGAVTLAGFVDGSVKVNAFSGDGTLGKAYTIAESAETVAAETFFVAEGGVVTLPTDETAEQFIIRYDREVEDGAKITNSADKFAKSVKLLLKALYYDPCEKNTLKGCYIELPSFQISPEVSLPLSSEATLDYTGDLEIDYCGTEKVLYNIYFADDEEE